ncbi:MAG: glycerol-3-phosphate dehydrogenase C-terminal domain-containing protein [Sciscionella sp.]
MRAEFEYAITHEGALDVDDIVDRRTRIGLVQSDRERVVDVAEEFLSRFG